MTAVNTMGGHSRSHAHTERRILMENVERHVKALNQALFDAALAGIDLKIHVGTGPYFSGCLNNTKRCWVVVDRVPLGA
jgi:hypothetical protein